MDSIRDDFQWTPPAFEWQRTPKFQDRRWLHALLLVLTIGTTTLAGGAAYSATILLILGCHELGHYFACRYYDVDASLPFFIPAPLMSGTLGAAIAREPIPSKRVLFDIGFAGPIAGFLVAVPALILGVSMSHVVQVTPGVPHLELGEPLLFKIVSMLVWGTIPNGYELSAHPVAFAAWFGLLATALNLFPAGQLDGGHITYAVFGRYSTHITLATIALALGLAWLSLSWLVWATLMIVMTARFGPRHPPTIDERGSLDSVRLVLALVALIMFIVCFTPRPTELVGLLPG